MTSADSSVSRLGEPRFTEATSRDSPKPVAGYQVPRAPPVVDRDQPDRLAVPDDRDVQLARAGVLERVGDDLLYLLFRWN